MRTLRLLALFSLIVFTLACDEEKTATLPVEPFIENIKTEFVAATHTNAADTLTVTFDFSDGDFDLGFDHSLIADYEPPYHNVYLFIDSNGGRIKVAPVFGTHQQQSYNRIDNTAGKLVTYRTEKMRGAAAAYDCKNFWYMPLIIEDASIAPNPATVNNSEGHIVATDTFLIERNPNHYNIEVDFLVVQVDGSTIEFDWMSEFCQSFDGRFFYLAGAKFNTPISNGPFEITRISKSRGTLRYAMPSKGFKIVLGGKQIKLRVSIKDRALNKSNLLETQPFSIN